MGHMAGLTAPLTNKEIDQRKFDFGINVNTNNSSLGVHGIK